MNKAIEAALEAIQRNRHEKRVAKIDAWASRMDREVADGFARFKSAMDHKEPKPGRVWP